MDALESKLIVQVFFQVSFNFLNSGYQAPFIWELEVKTIKKSEYFSNKYQLLMLYI